MQIITRNLQRAFSRSLQVQLMAGCSNIQTYNQLSQNKWLVADETHKKSYYTHKSQAEEFIHRVPVVEVESNLVRCIGGTELNAGHAQVYIQLNTRTPGQVQTCKYCGLRYKKKLHGHHH